MKSEDIIKIENLNKKDSFTIRWQLTYLCNYYCDFCIQGNKNMHLEKSKGESLKIRKKICDNLIEFIETKLNKKYDKLNIYLIGGEVTILKDFLDILKKIVNCNFDGKIYIKITSNLSAKQQIYQDIYDVFKDKKNRYLHISASYYKDYTSEEEFIAKVKILNKTENKKHFINQMKRFIKRHQEIDKEKRLEIASIGYPICNDNDYEEYIKFKKKYKNISQDIHLIVIKDYKTMISDKLKEKIVKEEKQEKNIKVTFNNNEVFYCENNNKIALKLDKEESFKSCGYLCDVGMNNISISNLGIVSRCPSCKEKTIIGNMVEGNVDLPKDKIICPSLHCNCSYYEIIEKIS